MKREKERGLIDKIVLVFILIILLFPLYHLNFLAFKVKSYAFPVLLIDLFFVLGIGERVLDAFK